MTLRHPPPAGDTSAEQTVLVDLFDTIIHRTVHPFSVIERWADSLACAFALRLPAREIAQIRRIGYLRLVALHDEPSYRQMMEDLYERLTVGGFLPPATDVGIFCEAALELEVAAEMKSHVPNTRMVAYLRGRKERGLTTHCVSDHYLPATAIRKFLEALGVSDAIGRIFVSSEYAATKRKGRLYPLVLSELGIVPEAVLMIGDNPRADGVMARRSGLRTKIIRNLSHRISNKMELTGRLWHLSRNPVWKHLRELSGTRRPFLAYALVYYSFTDRLYRRLKQVHAPLVVFLAREGMFLKRCFDQYQEENVCPSQRIRSAYLKLSRKAAAGVMLRELPDESFEVFGAISIRGFVEALPFDDAEADRALSLFAHQDIDRITEGFPGSQQLREIRENAEFGEMYRSAVTRNRAAFRTYLDGILGNEREIFLVDIGWRGKMQLNLHRFTSLPTTAFYLGFEFEQCQPHGNTAEGLIFSSYPRLSPMHSILQSNRQFYEQLAAAPHGAACSYAMDQDGGVDVREEWPEQERSLYEGTVREYQGLFAAAFQRFARDIRLVPEAHLNNIMLARIAIRCGLSTRRASIDFARLFDASFAANFRQETNAITYSPASVRIDIRTLLLSPEMYYRYAVKVPRMLHAKGLQPGYIAVHLYRIYLLFHLRVRGSLS